MSDLKEEFRKWLIKQGLSEKTKTGRLGTVYEYIRRIDKICDIIYSDQEQKKWECLARDIYPILGFHLICKTGKVSITRKNIDIIRNFLSLFLSSLRPYQESSMNYFDIKLRLDDGTYVEHYTLISDLLPFFTTEILFLNFCDSVSQVNKNRNALEKFHDFLTDNNGQNYILFSAKAKNENSHIGNGLKQLKKSFVELQSAQKLNMNFVIAGGTRTEPPKLIRSKSENSEIAAQGAGLYEVLEILQISRWTLKRLVEAGILHKNANDLFDAEEINHFIRKNFVPLDGATSADTESVKIWWTNSKAQAQTGLNRKYLERLRKEKKVSYIKVAPKRYLYYPPDLAQYSKVKPLKY